MANGHYGDVLTPEVPIGFEIGYVTKITKISTNALGYTLGKNSKFALTLKAQKPGEITSLNYILKL